MTQFWVLICTIAFTPSAFAEAQPPRVFVDKGACPFECCAYRDWTARNEIRLVDEPNGSRLAGVVNKGEIVKALTGEVHVIPTPMDVVFHHGRFNPGDRVFLLTYVGEGSQKVWSNGTISIEDLTFAYNLVQKDKDCVKPSAECWGRIIGKQTSVWWVQIQLKNGNVGWTKDVDRFDDKDACG